MSFFLDEIFADVADSGGAGWDGGGAIDWGTDFDMAAGAGDFAQYTGGIDGVDLSGIGLDDGARYASGFDWGSSDAWGGRGLDIGGGGGGDYAGYDAAQFGIPTSGNADIGAAPMSTAEADVAPVTAGGENTTMTPNARAARLASAQRTTDGASGHRLGGSGLSNASPSAYDRFVAKGTTALQDPMTYARLGLALAGAGGSTAKAAASPVRGQQGYDRDVAQNAADRAENAGLRTQINTNARNLEESGGANAFRSAQVRGANQVESLRNQLGTTQAPTFVKSALINKAQHQAGLNAQTAGVAGDVAARTAAGNLYKMAPTPSYGGTQAGLSLDSAYRSAQDSRLAQMKPIGSALESIFGSSDEETRRRAVDEGVTP